LTIWDLKKLPDRKRLKRSRGSRIRKGTKRRGGKPARRLIKASGEVSEGGRDRWTGAGGGGWEGKETRKKSILYTAGFPGENGVWSVMHGRTR